MIVVGVNNLRAIEDGKFVCAVIEFRSKKGVMVEMCDAYRIAGGRFAEVRPYFDPSPLMGEG